MKNNLCSWRRWSFCSFLSLFVNILFSKLTANYLCLCYMMFLDTWVIVLSVYKYLILRFIFLISLMYFLRCLRKKKNFVFKIIYLSIYYSHIGLDYDNIYTTLPLIFVKNFLYFFLRWNCSLLLIYFYIFI